MNIISTVLILFAKSLGKPILICKVDRVPVVCEGKIVWGATAMMLSELKEVIKTVLKNEATVKL